MPIAIAITIATNASSMVAGSLSRMSDEGRDVVDERLAEVAARRALEEHPVLLEEGLVQARAPPWRATRSTSSACGFTSSSTGLPMAYTPTKTRNDISTSTKRLCPKRRMA